ncbi:taste receptor type 2 member 1-like [Cavia porcellus]|uniref:taste receptor type 2 member 1-like n=1 Tax=Cavia porcellus TaxID=10141 RepID=UPI002FE2338E
MEMHHLIIHFLIVVTQFLTGVLTNGFIVVVNVVDFIKHRQMAPLDLLLSCLATSRITLQMLIILSHLVLLSFVKIRAPLRALLSILSFLILYFSHYMMSILFMFQTLQFGSFLFEFCSLTVAIYPSIHSVILILGNAKLKQSAKRFLLCGQ